MSPSSTTRASEYISWEPLVGSQGTRCGEHWARSRLLWLLCSMYVQHYPVLHYFGGVITVPTHHWPITSARSLSKAIRQPKSRRLAHSSHPVSSWGRCNLSHNPMEWSECSAYPPRVLGWQATPWFVRLLCLERDLDPRVGLLAPVVPPEARRPSGHVSLGAFLSCRVACNSIDVRRR